MSQRGPFCQWCGERGANVTPTGIFACKQDRRRTDDDTILFHWATGVPLTLLEVSNSDEVPPYPPQD